MSINVRSFDANSDELRLFNNSIDLLSDVVVLCETWFRSDGAYNLEEFISHYSFRPSVRRENFLFMSGTT